MKCKSLFKVHIADTEFIKSTYLYLINESVICAAVKFKI